MAATYYESWQTDNSGETISGPDYYCRPCAPPNNAHYQLGGTDTFEVTTRPSTDHPIVCMRCCAVLDHTLTPKGVSLLADNLLDHVTRPRGSACALYDQRDALILAFNFFAQLSAALGPDVFDNLLDELIARS